MDVSSLSPTLAAAAAPNAQGESKIQTVVKLEPDQQPRSGGTTPPAEDADSARGALLNTAA